jgi:hypothetical protein
MCNAPNPASCDWQGPPKLPEKLPDGYQYNPFPWLKGGIIVGDLKEKDGFKEIKEDPELNNERGRELVEEAMRTINHCRQSIYGPCEDSFQLIASYWNVYLDDDRITAQDVAMMMVLLKIAREKNQKTKDSVVDALGYLILYDSMNSD